MKKLLFLLLVIIFSITLEGCKSKDNSNDPEQPSDNSSQITPSPSDELLASAKKTAITNIESYVNLNDYSSENQTIISNLIELAKEEINNAANQEEINSIVDQTKEKLDGIFTITEETLKAVIDSAVQEIEEYYHLEDYSSTNQTLITTYVNSFKEEVEKCTTTEGVKQKLDDVKTYIDSILTISEEKLCSAINNAKSEIEEYYDLEDYSSTNQTLITTYVNSFKEEVEKCTTTEDVKQKLDDVKTYIDSILTISEEELVEAKKVAIDALNGYIVDKSIYSEMGQNQIAEIINEANLNIDSAADVIAIEAILAEAKSELDNVKTLIEEQEEKTLDFRNILTEETEGLFESSLSVDGTKIILDTEQKDLTKFYFGKQTANPDVIFDTKLKFNYRNTTWSGATIRFRAWDTAHCYKIDFKHSYIKVYRCTWDNQLGIVNTLILENSFGLEDGVEYHLQIICSDYQKSVLIDGQCIFSFSESDYRNGRIYFETWQLGVELNCPEYVEYESSDQLLDKYSELLNKDCINKTVSQILFETKETSIKEIEEYITDLSLYSESKQSVLASIISLGRDKIDNCSTKEEVLSVKEEIISELSSVKTIEREALELDANNAKNELNNYITDLDLYDEVAKAKINAIINETILAIDKASNVEDINDILIDAKTELDAILTIEEAGTVYATEFKNILVEGKDGVLDKVSIESGQLILETQIASYSSRIYFGDKSKSGYSVFDTYITPKYNSTKYDSFSILFRAWDTSHGYKMEVTNDSIKIYSLTWDGGTVHTLLTENSYGLKNNEEVHLQIICHEWQKTILINGECIFSLSEGNNPDGYIYIETWETGLIFRNPQYIEYEDSQSLKAAYESLLWKESINELVN